MATTTYGLDLAKRVFQLYWIDADSGEIHNKKFDRAGLIEFFANRPAGRIAIEACGSANWWGRKLGAMGHMVILLHARFIRPFVQNNKTDAADAKAIWTAVHQPGMRTVAAKSEEQQAILALHRIRAQLIKSRTAQVNQLRGLLYEFGVVLKSGRHAGIEEMRQRMAELEGCVFTILFDALVEQLGRISQLDVDIKRIEQRMATWKRKEMACKAIAEIPGVGLLTATALLATVGDARAFQSGRELAAFIGLVPRQNGTGGKIRLGQISKRGDPYLRTLLIHGARSVLFAAKEKGAWAEQLLKRWPPNVAVVALANKIVRIAWAVLTSGQPYQRQYISAQP
jgi:transposase